MGVRESFDVIIIGAGPAGLSVGSELSRDFKVLIVDSKKKIEYCTKSWFVPRFAIEEGDAAELLDFDKGIVYRDREDTDVPNGVFRFLTQTYTGPEGKWDGELEGGYPYLEEHALLRFWGDRIMTNGKQSGSRVLLNCTYFDHDLMEYKFSADSTGTTGKRVVVATSKGTYDAKLLIDASGHDSMVRHKYELSDESLYWWSVFGALVEHPGGLTDDLKLGDYLLWGTYRDTNPDAEESLSAGRPVFEYEVLKDERVAPDGTRLPPVSFPLILYLRSSKVPVEVMRAEFNHILRKEKATAPFHDTRITESKWGWYPSGGLNQKVAEDHVAFIGDAGCWSTPCGWGMAFIMRNFKSYAEKVAGALRGESGRCGGDPLSKKSLAGLVNLGIHDVNQVLLDKVAARFLSHAPAHLLDEFIRIWGDGKNQVPFLLCEQLFTLSIPHMNAMRVVMAVLHRIPPLELAKVFPLEELKTILKEAPVFGTDWVLTELQKHIPALDHVLPRLDRSGFDFE